MEGDVMASDTLQVRRGSKTKELPIEDGTIRALDLKSLGLMSYDPAYMATAVCTSKITYIDGEKGILRYRGYPIEELAEKSTFLESVFLLFYGDLPTSKQLEHFSLRIAQEQASLHTDIIELIHSFRHDAHSMTVMVSALAALAQIYPDANPALNADTGIYKDKAIRERQVFRLLGAFPTMAAHLLLQRMGRLPEPTTFFDPQNKYSYVESYLTMLGLGKAKVSDSRPDPRVVRALDILLLVHADHELNCSTAAIRHLTTSGVDVFTAASGATAALYGPFHGGANEAVLRMLQKIGSVEKIPGFLQAVKEKKAKLMGFGHRVYKNYDPRAKIVRQVAYEVFDVYGSDPLIHVATALEKAARADDYFVSRKLFPNIDFYSGLIYKAIGFPTDYFPVLFAMGRMGGWLSHWDELLTSDAEQQKIVRPRQIYRGSGLRHYDDDPARRGLAARNYDSQETVEPIVRSRL